VYLGDASPPQNLRRSTNGSSSGVHQRSSNEGIAPPPPLPQNDHHNPPHPQQQGHHQLSSSAPQFGRFSSLQYRSTAQGTVIHVMSAWVPLGRQAAGLGLAETIGIYIHMLYCLLYMEINTGMVKCGAYVYHSGYLLAGAEWEGELVSKDGLGAPLSVQGWIRSSSFCARMD